MTRKTCEVCGVNFVALRSDGRYCGGTCRKAAHDRRHKLVDVRCQRCRRLWRIDPHKHRDKTLIRCVLCGGDIALGAEMAKAVQSSQASS